MATERFIVLRVVVEHEPDASVDDICREVEVFYDNTDGAITQSEVVQVLDKEPGSCNTSASQGRNASLKGRTTG